MTPVSKARQQIDDKREQAGWIAQDFRRLDLGAARGVAIRETSSTLARRITSHLSIMSRRTLSEPKPMQRYEPSSKNSKNCCPLSTLAWPK